MTDNIIETKIPETLCQGCGICVAICPSQCLAIKDCAGENRPTLQTTCTLRCRRCLQVCPFSENAKSKEEIAQRQFQDAPFCHSSIGPYSHCWAGYSRQENDRSAGASGGLTTWFMRKCLESGYVDRIINVHSSADPKQFFEFKIIDSQIELASSRTSRYYPVSMPKVLRKIREEEEEHSYLLTGLPCLLHAVRLACEGDPVLKRRIRLLLGLACGQCPNKHFTEVLSLAQGSTPKSGKIINYRAKRGNARNAYDYDFSVQGGRWPLLGKSMYGLYGFLWMNKYFCQDACFYCDDTFAAVADITFMDAWLPTFSKDLAGTNLVVIRNPDLNRFFEEGKAERTCDLVPVSVEDAFASQAQLARYKKYELPYRMQNAHAKEFPFPLRLRHTLDTQAFDRSVSQKNQLFLSLSRWSRANWQYFKKYKRLGVFLFLLVSIFVHLKYLKHFKEFSNILPGAHKIQCVVRNFKQVLKRILLRKP